MPSLLVSVQIPNHYKPTVSRSSLTIRLGTHLTLHLSGISYGMSRTNEASWTKETSVSREFYVIKP